MNVLVLIRELDATPLQREVRNAYAEGEVIIFCNETDNQYNLVIDNVEYVDVQQVCFIYKDYSYYLYIQQAGKPNLVKLEVDDIGEIDCFILS